MTCVDRYIGAEGGKNAECRNKEMAISRRLGGLRSSRLDHSMQNSTPELLEALPRPDSPDLEGKNTNNCGRDRRRRKKSPKAEKIAEGGKNRRRRNKYRGVIFRTAFRAKIKNNVVCQINNCEILKIRWAESAKVPRAKF